MFCRTLRLLLAGVGVAASSGDASAQVVRSLAVNATVPDIGVVVSVSALTRTDQSQAVSGTVNTKHNGPYLLQVRLTTVHTDTILARQPDGTYHILGTGDWTTVAAGPGGADRVNTVDYRIRWANGSGPRTSDAPTIGLSYRVVAP
jgi:hypothetical protein